MCILKFVEINYKFLSFSNALTCILCNGIDYYRSLENNNLTGSVPARIWQNISFSAKATLLL